MTERTVKGQIAQWGEIKTGLKKDNKSWFKISCNISGEWHAMFVNTAEEGEEIIKSNPVNSQVEFIEIEKGEYWSFKKNSWKLLKAGDNIPQTPTESQSTGGTTGGGVDWDAKDRRIVRQNSLMHADNWLNYLQSSGQLAESKREEVSNAYFYFAKKCEEWVYREKPKADEPVKGEEAVI